MLFLGGVNAQNTSKYFVPQSMKISSVEVQVGYYRPRLYAYNEVYFAQFSEGKFQGNTLIQGIVSLRLVEDWYLRGGLGYWQEDVQTETIIISDQPVYERLDLNMVMAEVSAVREIRLFRDVYLQVGLGAIINRISTDHDRVIADNLNNFLATSYSINAVGFGSLNYTYNGYLDIGIELKAIYGRSFNHFVADFGDIAMSTAGPAATLRIAYNFQNRFFFKKAYGYYKNFDGRKFN